MSPSAKVNQTERDLTSRVPSFPGARGVVVVDATKGLIEEGVAVTSETDYLKKYTVRAKVEVGDSLAHFSALAHLQASDDLVVVRAASSDADYGGLTLAGNLGAGTNGAVSAGVNDPAAYTFDALDALLVYGANQGDWNNDVGIKVFPYRANKSEAFADTDVDSTTEDTITLEDGLGVDEWEDGEAIVFSVADSTTDILPAPLVPGTTYYAIVDSTLNTIKVASTLALAIAGTEIDLTDDGTGTGDVFTVQLANEKTTEPDSFLIEVYQKNLDGDWVFQVDHLCSLTQGKLDGFGRNIYVDDKLEQSEWIKGLSNPANTDPYPKAQFEILGLLFGDDGSVVTDADMMRAADVFANPNDIFVTLIMDGGRATAAYGTYLASIAESRKDSFAILSVPYAKEASSNYLNDVLNYRKLELNLNSSYAGLYSAHVKIYDKYNDRNLWVSPDGFASAVISFTAAEYEMWYGAAGFRRGNLNRFNVLDVRRRYSEPEMDQLADAGINPLLFAPGRGILIMGQKTMLSRPSDLQDINVRLLLVVIEPAIKEALEDFLFEFNDATTRGIVRSRITAYLNNILSRRGVTDFEVKVDGENNTAEDIANNRMNVWVFVKPNKVIETINFVTVITAQGLTFDLAAEAV